MRYFLLLIPLVVLFILPSKIYGVESLSISPAFQEVVLGEGETEKDISITLTNNLSVPVALELFPINFRQENPLGGVTFLGEDSLSFSLSSFLSLETERIDLDPGDERKVNVKILNRQDLSPGGHYVAIVARYVEEEDDPVVVPAVSSLIVIRKEGGGLFNLFLKEVSWNPTFAISYPFSIRLTFQNEGNVHLIPYGKAEIKDIFGRLLYKGIVNSSSSIVFPQSRRFIPVEFRVIEKSYPFSINTLSISGEDSLKKIKYLYSDTFIYINPILFVGLGGMILGLGVFLFRKKRKTKK